MTAMLTAFAILLVVHGLIHVLGPAKAFHWAELPQLTQPIAPFFGALWLVAALLFLVAAVSIFAWPRWWWAISACALAVSMFVLVPAWTDTKAGALANAVVLVGVFFGFLSEGPFSLRAEYDDDIKSRVTAAAAGTPITDADLAQLPDPVRRYLRGVGVVGQPRVHNYRVRMHGRIRSGRESRWMPFVAEQYNFVDPPVRLFYLNASMFAIPVQGYHRYAGSSASMRAKAAALIPVATESGSEMTQSETVTLFNDMCLMAPATLLDSAIEWLPVDTHAVRARFTSAGHTISADLLFDDAGMLTNFVSADRYQSMGDIGMRKLRWSTPMWTHRQYGPVRLPAAGEARWEEPAGEYAYIHLSIDDVQYNVGPR